MPAKLLTRETLDAIHLIAATLVNDFVAMNCLLHGVEIKSRLPDNMPEGWAFPPVARGEVEGVEALNALRREILKLELWFDRMESGFRHDWANIRGREPICWGGQIYASGYGALCEFFGRVRDVLCLCWATEEELNELRESEPDADLLDLYTAGDQQTLADELKNIEGDNDILDLLVYAEQEYAILYREAEEREQGNQQEKEDWSAYRPASEFLDETKYKDLPALKRVLTKHPEIRTRKPSPQRLEIHAGDWLAYVKEQEKVAFAALGNNACAVDVFLQEARERRQTIRRSKAE